jgi:hypothetical protein
MQVGLGARRDRDGAYRSGEVERLAAGRDSRFGS